MTSNADPTPGTIGSLSVAGGAGVVRIEQRYAVDATELWSGLTEPDRLARWYGQVSGDLHEGGQFRVRIEGPDIDSTGRVVECRPASLLRVRVRETDESALRGNGRPFDTTVDVTLSPDGAGTRLVLEVGGLPLEKIAAYGVGWQLHAETLRSVVSGDDPPDVATRWAELVGAYETLASRLG